MNSSIILQVGVKVFLKNKNDQYLLLRRSPLRYPDIKNFWDIPGGRINAGTPLFENIRREIEEETKLKILKMPELISAQDILRTDKHIVRLTFLGEIEGQPTLDEEHTEYKWLTFEEMLHIKEFDEFTREVIEKKLMK